ncbi:Shedu anti-phage system protein SduA domain-containing protein [Bacillus altitudinis]|uniref:Shedu anti-phage system protein SduA domain-containing protein n=1 Tax=Bacillus altitudinis TaxID=293387 RepID=UPI001F61DCF1|nr:Shedu anti-phage system protein SduA domain-containing protein [Bacillus altitudinis]
MSLFLSSLNIKNKNTTLSTGHLGETFRKGLNQVSDWSSWLEGNYNSIYETFNKYKNNLQTLPIEFLKYDSSRIHFAVIAGKRDDFNEKTYEIKRQKLKERILLLHYDNLCDMSKNLIGEDTY